jgi:hypothetical protein
MAPILGYECTLVELAFFRASEEVVLRDVEKLAADILRRHCWTTPIPVERQSGIIMDGNHRWHAARLLQLTHLPCIALDYGDPRVRVVRWEDGSSFALAELRETVARGAVLPYKTTRHMFAPALPEVEFDLAALRRARTPSPHALSVQPD